MHDAASRGEYLEWLSEAELPFVAAPEEWPEAGGPKSIPELGMDPRPGMGGSASESGWHPDFDEGWMKIHEVAEIVHGDEASIYRLTNADIDKTVEYNMISQENADALKAQLRETERMSLEGLEIPGDPGGADAIEDALGHLNAVLGDLPSLEQWTREMDMLFPNLKNQIRRAGATGGPGWRPSSLAEERRLAAEIERWMTRRGGQPTTWEEILQVTERVSPMSMEEAIKSLQGAAGVGMATAITAQTLFPEQVERVVSGLGKFNDGWWSWIKDFPEHLDWMVRATGATLDGMEAGSRSTGDPVLDSLNDGWREQVGALTTQLGGGVMPLMGGTDASMLKGVGKDLSENGHNGNAILPNNIRREIENGDAMIDGYRTDADYERAVA